MKLKVQKRLAAEVLKCSKSKISLDNDRLEEIKEAITKADIRRLIKDKAIRKKPAKNTSRFNARKKSNQKRKGRQKGQGSKKGKANARLNKKTRWMNTIRIQRAFLKMLVEKKAISSKVYRSLYLKCKGGFFRSKRHLKLYIEEHGLKK